MISKILSIFSSFTFFNRIFLSKVFDIFQMKISIFYINVFFDGSILFAQTFILPFSWKFYSIILSVYFRYAFFQTGLISIEKVFTFLFFYSIFCIVSSIYMIKWIQNFIKKTTLNNVNCERWGKDLHRNNSMYCNIF